MKLAVRGMMPRNIITKDSLTRLKIYRGAEHNHAAQTVSHTHLGDFFGRRQHGLPALRMADLNTDTRVLKEARDAAAALLSADPDLSRPEHRPLLEKVRRLFQENPDMFN